MRDQTGPSRVDAALRAPIVTLVSRRRASPVRDPHEYVSYATYWWPNPATANGLPYVRRDGQHDIAQTDQGDRRYLNAFVDAVQTLALAWSGERRDDCARRAGEWLRAWFVAPETRMNPNLDYSQVQLGHHDNYGNGTGVLDGRLFGTIADSVRLLHDSPALTASEEAAVYRWYADYLDWLLTSPGGREEHVHPNNHGSWYLVQAITIARFCGRDGLARRLCLEDEARIAHQFEPDGSQPEELRRADAIGYSLFNLTAQFDLVRLAAPLGVDLAHYVAPNGGSLRGGLEYLKPFSDDPAAWKGHAVHPPRRGFLEPLLREAAEIGVLPNPPAAG